MKHFAQTSNPNDFGARTSLEKQINHLVRLTETNFESRFK